MSIETIKKQIEAGTINTFDKLNIACGKDEINLKDSAKLELAMIKAVFRRTGKNPK